MKKLALEHLYIGQSKQTRCEMDLSYLHVVYEAIFYPMQLIALEGQPEIRAHKSSKHIFLSYILHNLFTQTILTRLDNFFKKKSMNFDQVMSSVLINSGRVNIQALFCLPYHRHYATQVICLLRFILNPFCSFQCVSILNANKIIDIIDTLWLLLSL